MFLGEFQHSLDTKGRVILPARYRDQLAEGAYVTKGRGGCLSVFTQEDFEEVASQVRDQSKRGAKELNAARVFFSGAQEVKPDKQGRVALPQNLREYAGLSREVVVAGVFSRIEIWDRDRWLELDRVGAQALTDSDDLPEFGI
ncbi:MAG: division/cell wall cluster transcriptional repressor MraZ [Acidimicrobiia bacterium]